MSSNINAAIIITGNEVLSGRTQDKNSYHIIKVLSDIGIAVKEIRVIPDQRHEIIDVVRTLSKKYDYVFTTGGIGPTHDDITSEAVAAALELELVTHEDIVGKLEAYYHSINQELNEARIKMAKIPAGSKLLYNPKSIAPGFMAKNVVVMAGIPEIMHAMLDAALPFLPNGNKLHSKSIKTFISESTIAAAFSQLQDRYSDIEMGSYPFSEEGKNGTNLVISGYDIDKINQAYAELQKIVK